MKMQIAVCLFFSDKTTMKIFNYCLVIKLKYYVAFLFRYGKFLEKTVRNCRTEQIFLLQFYK